MKFWTKCQQSVEGARKEFDTGDYFCDNFFALNAKNTMFSRGKYLDWETYPVWEILEFTDMFPVCVGVFSMNILSYFLLFTFLFNLKSSGKSNHHSSLLLTF